MKKKLEREKPDIIEKYDKYNEQERLRREAIMINKIELEKNRKEISSQQIRDSDRNATSSSIMIGKMGLNESFITQLSAQTKYIYKFDLERMKLKENF
jgi:hypothetical protein